MISENRIRLMTKLASMEQEEGKTLEQARTYYRSDFISVHLLKNALRATLAFLLGVALWGCYHMEAILEKLNTMDIAGMAYGLLTAYAVTLVVYLALTYLVYSLKFYRAEKQMVKYNGLLKELLQDYDRETGNPRRRRRTQGGTGNGKAARS